MWVNLPTFRRGCQLQSYLDTYIFHTFLYEPVQLHPHSVFLFFSRFSVSKCPYFVLISLYSFAILKIKIYFNQNQIEQCAAKNLFFISLFFASQHQFVLSLSFGSFQPYCSYSSFLRKCATSTLPGSCDCCEWFKKDHWIMTWLQWKDELRNRVQGLVELEKAGM